jgi:hypothetical protein
MLPLPYKHGEYKVLAASLQPPWISIRRSLSLELSKDESAIEPPQSPSLTPSSSLKKTSCFHVVGARI